MASELGEAVFCCKEIRPEFITGLANLDQAKELKDFLRIIERQDFQPPLRKYQCLKPHQYCVYVTEYTEEGHLLSQHPRGDGTEWSRIFLSEVMAGAGFVEEPADHREIFDDYFAASGASMKMRCPYHPKVYQCELFSMYKYPNSDVKDIRDQNEGETSGSGSGTTNESENSGKKPGARSKEMSGNRVQGVKDDKCTKCRKNFAEYILNSAGSKNCEKCWNNNNGGRSSTKKSSRTKKSTRTKKPMGRSDS